MCELEHHRSHKKEVHLFKKKLEVYGLLHYKLISIASCGQQYN